MKQSNSWKVLERYAARILGGKRNSRGGDFSQSIPDIEHPQLAIECKYRTTAWKDLYEGLKQAESYSPNKIPLLVIRRKAHKALIVLDIEDFAKIYSYVGVGEK